MDNENGSKITLFVLYNLVRNMDTVFFKTQKNPVVCAIDVLCYTIVPGYSRGLKDDI